jgi:putative phosphoesterase
MKRIGVISDTHIPKAALDLPGRVYEEFRNVDLILHAGDLIELAVLEKLKKLAPTRAVCGNMDMHEVKVALPEKEIIDVEKFKIGLTHGHGPPGNIVETVSNEFKRVDVIIFGHSHSALLRRIEKTLFFNPGSPTDRIFAPYKSFGILEVGEELEGRIIKL